MISKMFGTSVRIYPRLYFNQNVFRRLAHTSMKKESAASVSKGMTRVYVTRRVPQKGIDVLLSAGIEVNQWDKEDAIPREQLLRDVQGVDGLFCLLTEKIDRELLERIGPQLKVVGTMSVGYDHIDMKECKDRGIRVGNTPDVLTHATAELTVSLLLATSRRIVEGSVAVKDGSWGTWKPMWLCGPSLENSTVGIFGFGRIGQQVARMLDGFAVSKFLYCSRNEVSSSLTNIQKVPFDTLLRVSDFIISCASLNDGTRDVFNADAFSKMKPSAVFINASRGPLVNQEALYNSLVTGKLAAAGLDVTVPEPLPLNSKLLGLNNCVILPHIGSATNEARSAMSELTARNIVAALWDKEMPAEINV